MTTIDNEKKFLEGLAALTRATGIAVGGCGCCGSPFLFDVETVDAAEVLADYKFARPIHYADDDTVRLVEKRDLMRREDSDGAV